MNFWSLLAGFVPVVVFLLGLRLMDSYKLVHRTLLVLAIAGGVVAALAAFGANSMLLDTLHVPSGILRAWAAPVVEEVLKALLVVWLVSTDRVGFVVDAAVVGFAVGTGFALAENLYYANALHDPSIALWLVRGLGTAIMHGTATALFAIFGKGLSDRWTGAGMLAFLPGIVLAIVVHATFNQLSATPLVTTAILLATSPVLLLAAFEYSDRATRDWLAGGFDGEVEMLESILDGAVGETPVGRYLETLRTRFEPLVVADLFCLLTIHLELSLRAKGMLIARSAGVEVPVDDSVRENLLEMAYLEKSVGPTGCLAMLPLRQRSRRDLWQILLLRRASAG
ncbi:MAG: PrsW family intramembrane metalloprotease [Candidatus Eisenbacteria bacterium]|nr:PrsW family intramembrane metalloprotease [Candidatus Eisenbacteria bacterium]